MLCRLQQCGKHGLDQLLQLVFVISQRFLVRRWKHLHTCFAQVCFDMVKAHFRNHSHVFETVFVGRLVGRRYRTSA